MRIIGLGGLDGRQLSIELQKGARFVMFKYCISIIILTFQRPSDIFFIRSGESVVSKGIGFSLISLLLGWWGHPVAADLHNRFALHELQRRKRT